MKRFLEIVSLSLICLTIFIGCNKDDDTDLHGGIVGKWKVIAVNQTLNGKAVPNTDDIIGAVIEFKSDLSYNVTYENREIEIGIYTITGDTIIVKDSNGDDETPVKFKFSSDGKLHLYGTRSDNVTTREIILIKLN